MKQYYFDLETLPIEKNDITKWMDHEYNPYVLASDAEKAISEAYCKGITLIFEQYGVETEWEYYLDHGNKYAKLVMEESND